MLKGVAELLTPDHWRSIRECWLVSPVGASSVRNSTAGGSTPSTSATLSEVA